MYTKIKKLVILAAGLALLTGCSSGSSPLSGPAETVMIYRANCLSCHGSELQGRMDEQSNLQQVGQRMSHEDIAAKITAGGNLMPPFAERLSPEEIDQLAAWLAEKK